MTCVNNEVYIGRQHKPTITITAGDPCSIPMCSHEKGYFRVRFWMEELCLFSTPEVTWLEGKYRRDSCFCDMIEVRFFFQNMARWKGRHCLCVCYRSGYYSNHDNQATECLPKPNQTVTIALSPHQKRSCSTCRQGNHQQWPVLFCYAGMRTLFKSTAV